MSDFIVTANTKPEHTHGLTKPYRKFLESQGYEVHETSVHGKNQTRFLHFVVQKDGQKYFCKVNTYDLYDTQINAGLASKLGKAPPHIRFLAPVVRLEHGDVLFYMYPFVDHEPISNEAKQFRDFGVPETDIDTFLERVLAAIAHIERQQLVTLHGHNQSMHPQDVALDLLKTLPGDTPYALYFLKYLLSEKHLEFRPAIRDIQPQNMFWDSGSQTLTLFDLEDIAPLPRYYDHAKFFAQLWVVYGRDSYARRFMELLFAQLKTKGRAEAFRYIRFNLTVEALRSYKTFRSIEDRQRTKALMSWLRKDLIELANEQQTKLSPRAR